VLASLVFVGFLVWIFRVAFRSEHMLQAHLDLFGKNARHLTPGPLVPFSPSQQKLAELHLHA
jgi:hypothetical protein